MPHADSLDGVYSLKGPKIYKKTNKQEFSRLSLVVASHADSLARYNVKVQKTMKANVILFVVFTALTKQMSYTITSCIRQGI